MLNVTIKSSVLTNDPQPKSDVTVKIECAVAKDHAILQDRVCCNK